MLFSSFFAIALLQEISFFSVKSRNETLWKLDTLTESVEFIQSVRGQEES